VNFFVIAPPRLLAPYAASFISAFRVEPGGEEAMNELAARSPTSLSWMWAPPCGRRRR